VALHLFVELVRAPGLWGAVLSWFLTYVVHALAWACAAALLARLTRCARSLHTLWKLSLFAPLVSALLSVALPAHVVTVVEAPLASELATLPLAEVAPIALGLAKRGVAEIPMRALSVLAWTLVVAAVLGLLHVALALVVLARRLRARVQVHDPRLLARLRHMRVQTRLDQEVRLSESAAVHSPLVVGLAEICIPIGLASALSDREIDAIFAHELAHLERRDGLWFLLAGLVQSVLWLVPFNAWSAARFRETAELSCDDRAVELTRDALSLASALTRVAELLGPRQSLPLTAAMARSRCGLLARVQRLVALAPGVSPQPRARRWAVIGMLGAGLLTVGLSVRIARAGSPSRSSEGRRPGQGDASSASSPVEARATAHMQDLKEAALVSAQMVELAQREAELTKHLDLTRQSLARSQQAESAAAAELAQQAESAQALTLEQELRHVRATQRWLEDRFLRGAATSQRAPSGLTRR
jgi:beta-lactamase regulating signal transducer with metallopeptidase domain